MLKVQCKNCNKELIGKTGKATSCGCSNMTTIHNDSISAVDLSKVLLISGIQNFKKQKSILSSEDLLWQEERRRRGVRRLNFDEC